MHPEQDHEERKEFMRGASTNENLQLICEIPGAKAELYKVKHW